MFYYTFTSEVGKITIEADESHIKSVGFNHPEPDGIKQLTPLISEARRQLEEYFNGKRKAFDLPVHPKGTPFQQRVWKALTQIPYGRTASYKEIAEAVKCSGGARAVGNANNKNPIAIIIPCHRVIGADGRLTGYAAGLDIKKYLLELESKYSY